MPAVTREEAARERAGAVAQRGDRPAERRDRPDGRQALRSPYRAAAAATPAFRAQFTVERAASSDAPEVTLRGYASAYEQPYEMWDMFGPYTEVVSAGAGEASLKRDPDVKFLFNHRDMPMARTLGPGTLQLSEDDHGLLSVAQPLMSLRVSQEVVAGVDAGLIDEMSYAFMISRGAWSPDWTEYRIHEYDIHRGDTSAVTYGANPFTDIGAERGGDPKAQVARKLRLLSRRVAQERALSTADAAVLQQLLTYVAAADAVLDPLVEVLESADDALDMTQATLASLLGVANPDADAAEDAAEGEQNDDLTVARSLTPSQQAAARRLLVPEHLRK